MEKSLSEKLKDIEEALKGAQPKAEDFADDEAGREARKSFEALFGQLNALSANLKAFSEELGKAEEK